MQRYDPDPAAKAAAATVLASKLGADSGLKVYLGDESNHGTSTGMSNDVELVQSSGLRNRKQMQSRYTTPGTATPKLPVPDQHIVGSSETEEGPTSEHNQLVVVEHHQPQSSSTNDGGWIARIAALLVGEDPTQSYALICGNCHMHNGEWTGSNIFRLCPLVTFARKQRLIKKMGGRICLYMCRSCSEGGFPFHHLLLPALSSLEQA